jgi:ADP-ribose pyrophosphatase YjhB (NUDIX family)
MKSELICPHCGGSIETFRNPYPTADILFHHPGRVLLIRRKNPPLGWALPGGFIDYGESAEQAAAREAKEETGLEVRNLRQFRVYSEPGRDPRFHTLTVVSLQSPAERFVPVMTRRRRNGSRWTTCHERWPLTMPKSLPTPAWRD